MTPFLRLALIPLVFLVFVARPAAAEESFSYADLVGRLTSLESLAVLPAPGEKCLQWSSYDRASRYDEKTGKYVRWDANGDGHGIIRREGKQHVFAEMEGPGCIWRIWSALPQKGRVKIFLDGHEQPVVEMPFEHYFDGKHAPFHYPLLSYRLEDQKSRGQNLYFPIPFQKSCKVTAEEGWGAYFHFTYTLYPKGTKLPTFSPALVQENDVALRKANDYFAQQMGNDPARRPDSKERTSMIQVDAGKTATVAELAGPAAITALRVKPMAFKDRQDEMAALRSLVLKITWDDEQQPAVWSPLGDFFGTAPGVNKYRSFPTGMTDDGFYALWYMPFAKRAVIELANDDTVARAARFEIVTAPLSRPVERLGRFHAKWHRDIFPLPKDRWPDWTMLRTQGRGRFCGVMLHVWNPQGGWWGEGDEKFFVDGEKFPSTIGTGSEDYFGYAWGDPHLFFRPYHCQTMSQNNKGHQSVLRWHVVDNVPFQTSFEACIEKYFGNERGCLFACLPVWYLAPGGQDPIEPVPVAQRHDYYVSPPLAAGGFKVIGHPPGNVETQGLEGFGKGKWDNDDQLWWTGAKPKDKLTVAFPVKQTGTYQVSVTLTKARDYGVVQLSIDGKKAGEPIDLYNDGVIPTGPIALGTFELAAGEHQLEVEIVGANEKAVKAYMFGLDRVILEPKR
jgi:hypothetical protein